MSDTKLLKKLDINSKIDYKTLGEDNFNFLTDKLTWFIDYEHCNIEVQSDEFLFIDKDGYLTKEFIEEYNSKVDETNNKIIKEYYWYEIDDFRILNESYGFDYTKPQGKFNHLNGEYYNEFIIDYKYFEPIVINTGKKFMKDYTYLTDEFIELYNKEIKELNQKIYDHNYKVRKTMPQCQWGGTCNNVEERDNNDCYHCDEN